LQTDSSQDVNEQEVADRFPAVRILPASENLGFARGNNFLAGHAQGRYLLLLNPDVEIHENAVGELYVCAEQEPSAGGWGGVTYLKNGRVDPSSCQSTPNLRRLCLAVVGFERWTTGGLSPAETQPREVEALSGAFMMLTTNRWRDMGGFDESFFMYAEELDLCYRLRSTGFPLVMTPKSRVIHLVGSGAGRSPKRLAAITRAKMHFLRKHRGRMIAALGGVLMWSAAMKKVIAAKLIGSFSRNKRFREVSEAYSLTAFHPRDWWNGYSRS
jgi:GT2 family glycosyltransferase